MKMLKWSWLGVFALAFVVIACQKDVGSPSEISAAKGGVPGPGTPPVAFILNIPTSGTGCVGSAYCFDASFTNRGGNPPGGQNNVISVAVFNASNTIEVSATINKTNDLGHSANFCISDLAEGNYFVRVTYSHTPSDNATPTQGTYSFPLTIQSEENCGSTNTCATDGLTLSRTAEIYVTQEFVAVDVTVNYLVSNCTDEEITGLKLQGGLVNKAVFGSATPPSGATSSTGDATNIVYNRKTTGGNNVLTWTFNLPAEGSQVFRVLYSVYPTACSNPLTGPWSLKKDGGTVGEIPLSQQGSGGYLARLYWVCD